MKIGIVGAGISGLAMAYACEQAGHSVVVYERDSSIGGRMKSMEMGGYYLDYGFHVLHTAYPTVQRWFDLKSLDIAPMDPCTMTIHPETGKRRLLGDALRAPKYLPSTVKSVGLVDGIRLLKWRFSSKKSDIERPLDSPSPSIQDALEAQRFRPSTKRILRQLFTGITLDGTLSERFAFAQFTWGAMAHGDMVVPKNGIQMVPAQLYQALKSTHVELNQTVTEVTSTEISTLDRTDSYDMVVLATPQHITEELLGQTNHSSHHANNRCTSTVIFEAPSPPYSHARLMVNEQWGDDGHTILHVHIPTNAHAHPEGKHLVVATLVGLDVLNPDASQVQHELSAWFGKEVEHWGHVTTTKVEHALPISSTHHHQRISPEVELNGVILIGDHRAHASVQGALASVERALHHLNIPLPKRC